MRITNRDVWMEVIKMRQDLAPTIQNASAVPDHENRIRSLERWKYGIPAGIVGVIVSLVKTFWTK